MCSPASKPALQTFLSAWLFDCSRRWATAAHLLMPGKQSENPATAVSTALSRKTNLGSTSYTFRQNDGTTPRSGVLKFRNSSARYTASEHEKAFFSRPRYLRKKLRTTPRVLKRKSS